jgi:hypothetical protein
MHQQYKYQQQQQQQQQSRRGETPCELLEYVQTYDTLLCDQS